MATITVPAGSRPNRYLVPVPFPSFGRSRTDLKAVGTSTGRHRTPQREQAEDASPDRELESYLAALAPDSDPETTGSGRRFGGAEVYQLRLSLMANEQLRELAAYRQTSPMALAQEWIMQRLEWEAQQLQRS
ncbi:hypothetical protein Acsp05_19460 [Actinokineospora sp. NBRC 105648]|nr:hypothetical protein Acsp05_19460 [Actinokineospora sp. NBRC 105648]